MATRKTGKGLSLGSSSDGRYRPVGDACECLSGPAAGTALVNGNTFTQKALVYANVDGHAVFEGDIVLGSIADMDHDGGLLALSVGISDTSKRWPNATIPYEIDPALPNQSRVTDAIAHWQAHTRIRFVARTAANAAAHPNYVRFVPGSGCSSFVGMRGGAQNITLGSGCTLGNTIHEIGHAVGLWHEQSREDRDLFVRVRWENIQEGREHNFSQHIADGDDLGSYDYGSIMHYPTTAFSKNGEPTLEVIGTVPPGVVIGQRSGLSAGDIAGVHQMYPATTTLKESRKDLVKDPIKDGRKDGIKEPIKDGRKDGIKDGLKDPVKEINKDGVKDPIRDTVKEIRKDPIRDPIGTVRETIGGGLPGPFGPNRDAALSAMPFIAASPTRYPDATAHLHGVSTAGEYEAALAQLQEVEALLGTQTQALGELFRQRDELLALIAALESGA